MITILVTKGEFIHILYIYRNCSAVCVAIRLHICTCKHNQRSYKNVKKKKHQMAIAANKIVVNTFYLFFNCLFL